MISIVAERGQVTIPKPLREQLGIRPSCALSFSVKDGTLIAVKANPSDPVGEVTGCLKTKKTSDELMKEIRGQSHGHRR